MAEATKPTHLLAIACLAIGLAGSSSPAIAQTDGAIRIATALPVTHSITSALIEGTGNEVGHVPERPRPMGQLPQLFLRQAETLAESLVEIDAVVTIGKLWSDDPLYTVARAGNLRVVDIDATKPWSLQLEGIAVATTPATNAPWAVPDSAERTASPYFWLSPANGARAADIISRDLMRLAPADAARIEQNLADFRSEMLALQTEYQLEFAELPDLTVAALASEFVYLTNAFGIYVDSYFVRQDVDWTDEDLAAMTAYLQENAIRVVLHKWEPDERIASAVRAGNASLVVLDPLDLGLIEEGRFVEDSYQRLLRANLAKLLAAFAASQ